MRAALADPETVSTTVRVMSTLVYEKLVVRPLRWLTTLKFGVTQCVVIVVTLPAVWIVREIVELPFSTMSPRGSDTTTLLVAVSTVMLSAVFAVTFSVNAPLTAEAPLALRQLLNTSE